LMRADRMASDRNAFDQLMRILLHEDSVVERARLALVRVDAKIDRTGMVLRQEGPLQAGREPCPAAPAKTGILHSVRDDIPLPAERFFECLVAAIRAIARQRGAIRLMNASQQDWFKLRHRENW